MNLKEGRSRLTGLALQKRLAGMPLHQAASTAEKKGKLMWHGSLTPLRGEPRTPFHVGTKKAALDRGKARKRDHLTPMVLTPSKKVTPFGKAKKNKGFRLKDQEVQEFGKMGRVPSKRKFHLTNKHRGKRNVSDRGEIRISDPSQARLKRLSKLTGKSVSDLEFKDYMGKYDSLEHGRKRYHRPAEDIAKRAILPYDNDVEDKGSLSFSVRDPEGVTTLQGLALRHKKDKEVAKRRLIAAKKLRRLRHDPKWRAEYKAKMQKYFGRV